jgi:L-cysteine:1D-myo-inositol 2-amino-2-deoxy-alpha-D-glucopyranoside ligase
MDRNGFVYQLDGDLYFDITTFLSDLPLSLPDAITAFSEKGGDPGRVGKKHPLDPILWLSHRDGEPGWESSHGFGRPGWHIECCVIALRYLLGEHYLESTGTGPAIDLQGGGSDLVFPHHFMSAAQGAALLGRPFAKDYVHSGMVGLDGEKMSKSKGNLVFVSTLLSDGVDPVLIRYALLSDHYQSDRMWSADKLSRATDAVTKIRTALAREEVVAVQSTSQAIVNAVANNLDTPAALKALETWAQETLDGNSLVTGGAGELSRLIDALLGLAL